MLDPDELKNPNPALSQRRLGGYVADVVAVCLGTGGPTNHKVYLDGLLGCQAQLVDCSAKTAVSYVHRLRVRGCFSLAEWL